jgi:hypothetical protein
MGISIMTKRLCVLHYCIRRENCGMMRGKEQSSVLKLDCIYCARAARSRAKKHQRYRNFSAIFAALAKCCEYLQQLLGREATRGETRGVSAHSCKRLLSLRIVRQSLCKNKLLQPHPVIAQCAAAPRPLQRVQGRLQWQLWRLQLRGRHRRSA